MVLPSNAVPPDAGWIAREIAALRGELREGLASVASSFRSTVAELAGQQQQLQAQVAFLLDQTAYAELWNIPATSGVGYVTVNPATADTGIVWRPFAADADATLDVTTSSTGKLAVTLSGLIGALALNTATASAFLGLEVLQGGTQLKGPTSEDGPYLEVQGLDISQRHSSTAAPILLENYIALAPSTLYTLRTRRGYRIGPGGTGSGTHVGTARWYGAAISATKLGM